MLIENISNHKINVVRKVAESLEKDNDTFTSIEVLDRLFHEYGVVVSLNEVRCILREFMVKLKRK